MSFATLCLHVVHVRMADPQEEISRSSESTTMKRSKVFLVPHHTVGAPSFASCKIAYLTCPDCGRKGWVHRTLPSMSGPLLRLQPQLMHLRRLNACICERQRESFVVVPGVPMVCVMRTEGLTGFAQHDIER